MADDHENREIRRVHAGSEPAGRTDRRITLPAELIPDEITSHIIDHAQFRAIYGDVDKMHERRAQLLKAALDAVGIESNVHQDRSPWGVRIGLVPGEYSDPTYDQPSLFVLTEGRTNIAGQWAWEWDLCLGNFGEYGNGRFEDLTGHILERTWLGEDVNKSARIIKDYVLLLTKGARVAHAQQLFEDQKLADDQEFAGEEEGESL